MNYVSEGWTLNSAQKKKVLAMEMESGDLLGFLGWKE